MGLARNANYGSEEGWSRQDSGSQPPNNSMRSASGDDPFSKFDTDESYDGARPLTMQDQLTAIDREYGISRGITFLEAELPSLCKILPVW